MKNIHASLLITITLILASALKVEAKGFSFSTIEGKMSISFPSSFNKEVDNTNGVDIVKATSSLGEQTFFASYTIHNMELGDPESLAEVSLNAFNETVGGSINTKSVWKLKAGQGIDATIDLADRDAIILYRVIIINNIQYQLVVISPNSALDKSVSDKFFKSFKVMK